MRNLDVSSCHQIADGHFIPIVMAEGRLGQETATTNQVNCVAVGWFENGLRGYSDNKQGSVHENQQQQQA
jgi:hypothetical protein